MKSEDRLTAVIIVARVATAPIGGLVKEKKIQDNNCDHDDPPCIGVVRIVGTIVQIAEKHFHHLNPSYAKQYKG